ARSGPRDPWSVEGRHRGPHFFNGTGCAYNRAQRMCAEKRRSELTDVVPESLLLLAFERPAFGEGRQLAFIAIDRSAVTARADREQKRSSAQARASRWIEQIDCRGL